MKRSPLFIICLIGLVDLSSFGLIIPLLPEYAHRFGASGKLLGLLLGSYSLTQFVFAPLLGQWSDRVGRRKILLVSVAGSIVSHTLLGVADLADSIPMLFVARVLDGLTGANIATAQAYIADVTTGGQRARSMGLFGAMIGLGFVVGPIIGGSLMKLGRHAVGDAGTSWPAFGAAAISAVAFVLVALLLPEPDVHRPDALLPRSRLFFNSLPELIRNPRVLELLVLFVHLTVAFVFLELTFVYLCKDRFAVRPENVMYVFAYIGVLIILVRGGLVGRLVRLLGEPAVISLGPFITAAGFFIIAATEYYPALWLLMIACIPVALGNGVTEPSMHALLSRQADASIQGLALGSAAGLNSLARGVVPFFAGWAYDRSFSLPYWLGGALFLLAGAWALLIRRRQESGLNDAHNLRRSTENPAGR